MLVDDRLTKPGEIDRMVGKRFYGHDVLYSKYTPQIPASADREYKRLVDDYMKIVKDAVEEELPKIKEVYKEERDASVRNDGELDLALMLQQVFGRVKNQIVTKTSGYGLRHKLEAIASVNRRLTVKEWQKAVKTTLGIDIREDYYLGDFFSVMLDDWVDENVDLIKDLPEQTADKLKDVIYDGYTNGKTTTKMVKDIQRVFRVDRRRAELIARDQTAKLNGKIQQAQQQDAGITEYVWSTSGDERVRESHKALEGQKFSWDDAPLNSDGRKCHPGEDYQCRCIGRPVFNRQLRLPIDKGTYVEENKVAISNIRNSYVRKEARRYATVLTNSNGNKDMLTRLNIAYNETEAEEDLKMTSPFAIGPTSKKLFYNPNFKGFSNYPVDESLTHELAHLVDEEDIQSFYDEAFLKAIEDTKILITDDDIDRWFGNGGEYENECVFSDIISALTEGKRNDDLPASHSIDYWNEQEKNIPEEIFANLTTLDIMEYKTRNEPKLERLFEEYERMVRYEYNA